jgi:FkbH-like protein
MTVMTPAAGGAVLPFSGGPSSPTTSETALTVAVAATFTAEGLEPPLAFMLNAAGFSAELVFAPYHQLFQELLTPTSTLARNTAGVNLLLVRLEDFLRDTPTCASADELLSRTLGELIDAATQFARRSSAPAIVVVMRPLMASDAMSEALERATAALCEALRAVGGLNVLVSDEIDPLCATERFDPIADRLAHIPYTDDYLAALAIVVARRIHLLRTPAHKVLVLDCDNTIWRGVVGEDGPGGVALDPAFLGVQDFAVAVQAEGALVCLVSKNVEADVIEVFDTRSDMVLKPAHIVAHRINWEEKASNLRSLAGQLNVGLDSFVFVDDNPVECGQMLETLPEVVTLQLPPPDEVGSFLGNLWTFDKAAVTQEDARRTSMYRENAARDSFEAEAQDIGEFLAALELKIEIASPGDDEWPRVSQLTQRTNQFNFTTTRRSEAEMRALAAAGVEVLAVHVRDRFGDYGLVGVVIAQRGEVALEVDTFLLSCRVLGRGVEHAIVAKLGELAGAGRLAAVRLTFTRTSKNEPARAFADSIVAPYREGEGDAFVYVVPAAFAAAIKHRAGADAEEVIEARRADAKKAPKPAAMGAGRSARYLRLATELNSGPAVMRALRSEAARPRDLTTAVTAPRSATERALVVVWEEILGINGLGIDDDFFALGGSSLQAARMFAEIAHRRGISLPLTTILEAPTVQALAGRVDRGSVARNGGLIALRPAGDRKLFLVHDGDGETLLYRNIALRAPVNLSVFGIQPTRLKSVPLAHASIEEMASSYVASVREVQPHGPYLLGGMCAGGLIAYEMALQLTRAGEPVERVLLLDTATPQAERRRVSSIAQRSARLGEAIAEARGGRRGIDAATAAMAIVARKVASVASYEVGRIVSAWSVRARFALLRRVLAGHAEWPVLVPSLDFRAIYNEVEARYRPSPTQAVSVLLLRASIGEGADLPYVEVYQDATLGWGAVVRELDVADVAGGHASMLQEPHAAALAAALTPYIGGVALASGPQLRAAHG